MSDVVGGWTSERIAKLRQLWVEGLSASDIGGRLGVTKNAVLGKAHRENLPLRPSPIRADVPAEVKARKAVARAGRLAFKAAGVARPSHGGSLVGATLVALGVAAAPVVAPVVAPTVARVAQPRLGGHCSYPLGEPRTPSFRYCDAPAVLGRSYCPDHHALCVAPSKERSEAQRAADLSKAGIWRPRARPATGAGWDRF